MFPLPLEFQKCPTRRSDDVLPPVPRAHLHHGMSSFVWRLCYIFKNQRRPMDVGDSKEMPDMGICVPSSSRNPKDVSKVTMVQFVCEIWLMHKINESFTYVV
jgi:hypothetical protein